ncbi:S8 family peptidase [Ideonella sp. BN130291]|uniref:S8 family peptidase n=1 Tax=Ideonella sp. BN130291 TaxID=3112940 RepID=UPI002E257FEF|nr:S8 family serine peptidase [Ideonella sp. BN130291]
MNTLRPPLRVPRRLVLRLKLGELPDHLPSLREVRCDGVAPATRIDGGPIDRLLAHHGVAARSMRLHSARITRLQRPGVQGARRFDDLEQLSGVARVLRIEVADDAGVPALVQALAQVTQVDSVMPDWVCTTPFDAHRPQHAAQIDPAAARRPRALVRLPQALALQRGDPSVIVGLADTGVARHHGELARRLRRGFDTVDLDAAALGDLTLVGDNTARDEEPEDEVGHGSACAGILRASGTGLPAGGAGLCGLTPVRVLGAALQGDKRVGVGALANIDAGMKRLIDLGVQVINMSFGTPDSALGSTDPRPHEEVVRYALARGVLLVAASGNSGREERYYPAAHEGVIAVGAVDDAMAPSSFSTRGGHVALCAPGRDIWTCGLDGYACVSGTSFAAPFVAAACALLVAHAQSRAWPLDPQSAREILVASAQPFASPRSAVGCGAGVLDALAALTLLDQRIAAALGADS